MDLRSNKKSNRIMRFVLPLFIIMIFVFSCKDSVTTNTVSENNNNLVQDSIIGETDIQASFAFNKENKIEQLQLIVELDERSGNFEKVENIESILLNFGLLEDTIINQVLSTKDSAVHFKENKLIINLKFQFPILDSLDIIELTTVALCKKADSNENTIVQSEAYYYKNTAKKLEIENTYLHYAAFQNKDVVFKVLSLEKGFVKELLVTARVNQNIDKIEKIDLVINDVELEFYDSILASFQKQVRKSNKCELLSFIKRSKKYVELKVNIRGIKIREVERLKVAFNEVGKSNDKEIVDESKIRKVYYFDNGEIEAIIYQKDSLLDDGNICSELHLDYHRNGQLKEWGCQGSYHGSGAMVGTWFKYDTTGLLLEKTYYHLAEFKDAYMEVTEFYPNGKTKAIKRYKNAGQYEIDQDSIGEWQFFE